MSAKKFTKKQPAPSVAPSERPIAPRRNWDARLLSVGCRCAFGVFGLWFLGIVNRDSLFVVQEYNLFLDDGAFFASYVGHVGGMLQYGARFLSQSFLFPFFGAVLLTAVLLLVQLLTAKLFRLDGRWTVLSFLPSFLFVRLFTQLEYRLFDPIVYLDDLYGCVLGILLALAFSLTYGGIARPFGRLAFGIVGVAALYWGAGVFGLLGLVLCLFREFRFPQAERRTLRQELLFLGGLLVPLAYYLLFIPAPLSRLFLMGIPMQIAWGFSYSTFVLLITTPIALALFDLFREERISPANETERRGVSTFALIVNVAVFGGLAGGTVHFSHANPEFLATVKMCRLLKQRDWEGILRVPLHDPEPIQPIVWMRNLALFKLGRLGEEAFSFPQFSKRDPLLEVIGDVYIFGDKILYEFGLVNSAFKTAHNQYVSRGTNRTGLETFVRCSLVTGENELTQRYLRLMRRAPLLRSQAATWSSAEGIEAERATIRRLIPTEDRFERPFASLEPLILEGFPGRNFAESPSDVQEMLLFITLRRKDLQGFRRDFDTRWKQETPPTSELRRIPKHFQEAILLDSNDLRADIEKYRLSPEIVERFRQFDRFRQAASQRSPTIETFRQEFGDTYWFYYSVDRGNN